MKLFISLSLSLINYKSAFFLEFLSKVLSGSNMRDIPEEAKKKQ